MSKPLELKFEKRYDEVIDEESIIMTFFYDDNTKEEVYIHTDMPKGFELNRHYAITDIYGYKVIDDRKGL